MPQKSINIIKSTGDLVPFSPDKLKHSLQRSGAAEAVINEVVNEVVSSMHEGMTTREIYSKAFKLLKRRHSPSASRYTLKRAIMDLGPSGFPFEKYVGEVFRHLNYQVKMNQAIAGQCVNHEVDIVAENETEYCVVECKYHNSQSIPCDVKVPLYVNSRYRDISAMYKVAGRECRGWIVTNTKFTTDAVKYGECAGLHLLSWDYPVKNSLKEISDRYKIYPVTCLTTLTKKEKQLLLEQGIILCKDLAVHSNFLSEIKVSEGRIGVVVNEVLSLIS